MKKFFTIALVALATVFAVSCSKDDDKTEKKNLVGTSWEMSFEGTLQNIHLAMDEILNFTSEDAGNRHVVASYGEREVTDDADFSYTWDGTTLSVKIGETSPRVFTYRASDNTFYMALSGDDEMMMVAAALGISELVYHQIQ